MLKNPVLTCEDLGTMPYAQAWQKQCQCHEKVLQNRLFGVILLVEHDPVITLSHRKTVSEHLLASPEKLTESGIDLQPTNRGGDITYHGPGQLVAYPILRLKDFNLTVGSYMCLLQKVVINTLATFNLPAHCESGKIGVWTPPPEPPEPPEAETRDLAPRKTSGGLEVQTCDLTPRETSGGGKICAMGVRVKRGISLHGLALNVDPDMSHFDNIVPCGIKDRSVTSLKRCMGPSCPEMSDVKNTLMEQFATVLDCEIDDVTHSL